MYFQDCNSTKQIASNSYESVDFIGDRLNRLSVGFRDIPIQASNCFYNSSEVVFIIAAKK